MGSFSLDREGQTAYNFGWKISVFKSKNQKRLHSVLAFRKILKNRFIIIVFWFKIIEFKSTEQKKIEKNQVLREKLEPWL